MCFFCNSALVFGTNQSDTMSLYPSIGQISVGRAEMDNVYLYNVEGFAIAFSICVLVEVNAHNEKRCVALFVSSRDICRLLRTHQQNLNSLAFTPIGKHTHILYHQRAKLVLWCILHHA